MQARMRPASACRPSPDATNGSSSVSWRTSFVAQVAMVWARGGLRRQTGVAVSASRSCSVSSASSPRSPVGNAATTFAMHPATASSPLMRRSTAISTRMYSSVMARPLASFFTTFMMSPALQMPSPKSSSCRRPRPALRGSITEEPKEHFTTPAGSSETTAASFGNWGSSFICAPHCLMKAYMRTPTSSTSEATSTFCSSTVPKNTSM
mmetsp:Transcript_139376/g.433615  ORF Transcript_139376/g.433615 Transcript_139376/m.433615 type:complete len:208 (-) Transcript_139376:736-1359(-)